MNTSVDKILSQTAEVDKASVQPFTGSQKIYVQGSRPDIRVPMREITLADTPTDFGGEKNPPVRVYDTSGPYTDPNVTIDLRTGLGDVRSAWIEERNDTEILEDSHSEFTNARLNDPKLAHLRFNLTRKPRRAKPISALRSSSCSTLSAVGATPRTSPPKSATSAATFPARSCSASSA